MVITETVEVIREKKDLEEKDIQDLAATLANAFYKYPFWRYVFQNDKGRFLLLFELFRRIVKYVDLVGGEILSIENRAGIALLLPPGKDGLYPIPLLKSGLWKLPRVIGIRAFLRLMRAMHADDKLRENNAVKPFHYLWFIAVNADKQGQGLGSILLKEIAHIHNTYAYTETHDHESAKFYNNNGFRTMEIKEVLGSYHVWSLMYTPPIIQ